MLARQMFAFKFSNQRVYNRLSTSTTCSAQPLLYFCNARARQTLSAPAARFRPCPGGGYITAIGQVPETIRHRIIGERLRDFEVPSREQRRFA